MALTDSQKQQIILGGQLAMHLFRRADYNTLEYLKLCRKYEMGEDKRSLQLLAVGKALVQLNYA